jgi:hypothetical protein
MKKEAGNNGIHSRRIRRLNPGQRRCQSQTVSEDESSRINPYLAAIEEKKESLLFKSNSIFSMVVHLNLFSQSHAKSSMAVGDPIKFTSI